MISFQYSECSPDHVGSPGGPRPKNQDGGVRVSIVHMHILLTLNIIVVIQHHACLICPQALIKRRLENRAKRNSTTQLNPMGLIKGNR